MLLHVAACIHARRHPGTRLFQRVRGSLRSGFSAAALVVATVGLTTACGPRRTMADMGDRAMIIFANESVSEATLYVSASGTGGQRMGSVSAGRTDTLAIPGTMQGRGTLTFYADLLASPARPSTGSVSIGPGEWLLIRLPSSLNTLVVLPAP